MQAQIIHPQQVWTPGANSPATIITSDHATATKRAAVRAVIQVARHLGRDFEMGWAVSQHSQIDFIRTLFDESVTDWYRPTWHGFERMLEWGNGASLRFAVGSEAVRGRTWGFAVTSPSCSMSEDSIVELINAVRMATFAGPRPHIIVAADQHIRHAVQRALS